MLLTNQRRSAAAVLWNMTPVHRRLWRHDAMTTMMMTRDAVTPVHPWRVQQERFLGVVVGVPPVRRLSSVCIKRHSVVQWILDTLLLLLLLITLIVVVQYCDSNQQRADSQSHQQPVVSCEAASVYISAIIEPFSAHIIAIIATKNRIDDSLNTINHTVCRW